MAESEYRFVNVESFDDGTIVRLMLNRPETRNAQHRSMLVELNEAFLAAEADDNVRVVILGGEGPMFSSGHDTGSKEMFEELRGPNSASDGEDQRRLARGRREPHAPGVALLLPEHAAVAQPAQDHGGAGARRACTPPASCSCGRAT